MSVVFSSFLGLQFMRKALLPFAADVERAGRGSPQEAPSAAHRFGPEQPLRRAALPNAEFARPSIWHDHEHIPYPCERMAESVGREPPTSRLQKAPTKGVLTSSCVGANVSAVVQSRGIGIRFPTVDAMRRQRPQKGPRAHRCGPGAATSGTFEVRPPTGPAARTRPAVPS